MLAYLPCTEELALLPPGLRQHRAVRAAIAALDGLHSLHIVHGDISERNVLLLNRGANYIAYWVDLSSSIIDASTVLIRDEREEALDYFSSLVRSQSNFLIWNRHN